MPKDGDTSSMTAYFDVIVTASDGPRIEEAAPALAKGFCISPEAAVQVLKSAPIIFLSGLKRSELRSIKASLSEVSKLGVEFKVTTKPSPAIPRVVWPSRPNIELLGNGAVVAAVGFHFGTVGFTCPSCGEVMVVRQLGKPLVHPAAPPAAPAAAAAPAPVPAKAAPPPAAKPAPKPIPKPAPKAAPPPPARPAKKPAKPVEEDEPLELADEPLDIVEEDEPVEEVQEAGEFDLAEPLEEIEEVPEIDEEPVKKPAAKFSRPAPKPAAKPSYGRAAKIEEEETLEVADEPAEKPKLTPSRISADGEPLFSVFLSKINDAAKQAEAAKLIAEIRGIPLKEAKDKVKGMLIPVLKDVSKDEADACLEKFQKMKIAGKVTKKK